MDDILLAPPFAEELQHIFLNTEIKLKEYGLHIAVDEFQEQEPYTYLGYEIWVLLFRLPHDSIEFLNSFKRIL